MKKVINQSLKTGLLIACLTCFSACSLFGGSSKGCSKCDHAGQCGSGCEADKSDKGCSKCDRAKEHKCQG